MDGKTLRGSGHGDGDRRHLLAAFDHSHGVVLGQVEVGAKTNEIPIFSTLLDRLTSPAPSSPPIPCMPSVIMPPTWPGAALSTC
jgi:hypothetical protein